MAIVGSYTVRTIQRLLLAGILASAVVLLGSTHLRAQTEPNAPIEVTFIATSYTGPAKSINPSLPAIVHHAVTMLNGKIAPNYLLTSVSRGWQLLETQDNICVAEKLRLPEREHLGYFSKYPIHIYPPHRLQTHADVARTLQEYKSLSEILENTDIVIGITKTINYGSEIMPLIKKHPQSFYVLSNANNHEEMLDTMVLAGRIDANFRASHNEWENQKKLVPLPFEEANTALEGHLLCSRTDIGKKAVALLNHVMTKEAFQEFFLEAHLRAFPESEHIFIEDQMGQIFTEGRPN